MTSLDTPDLDNHGEVLPKLSRRSLTIALLLSREKLMSQFRPMLASHNLTEQQWRVLRVVCEDREIDATMVAKRSCILAPSVSRILRRLEEHNLIARTRDTNDSRRTIISITRDGIELIAKIAPKNRRIYSEFRAGLGEESFEQLLDLLEKLNDLPAREDQQLDTANYQHFQDAG